MKILWLMPRWPVLETDGARVASAQLLRAVGRAPDIELSIYAVLAAEEEATLADAIRCFGAREVVIARRADRISGSKLAGYLWRGFTRPRSGITFSAYSTGRLRRAFDAWLAERHFDIVVFDGLHGAAILDRGGRLDRLRGDLPTLYRAHNVETDIWKSSAQREKNPFRRMALEYQAAAVERFEKDVIAASSLTAAVSGTDERGFRGRLGADRTRVIRIGREFGAEPLAPTRSPGEQGEQPRFGFIGRLDWLPNREGLEFLLQDVWPEVQKRRPAARLQIVGKGASFSASAGVEYLGYLPDTTSFYAGIDALLVPIFSGSGTRVKAIEACGFGRASIGTSLGMEGLDLQPGTDFIQAESAREWIEALCAAQPAQLAAQGARAWKSARERFDPRGNADLFLEALRELGRIKI
jgi:polysaccharide biosynthesis protein PslH